MTRNSQTRRHLCLGLLSASLLLSAGCSGLLGEIEALFAPASFANALFVLDSVFFDVLAPFIY